jgi:hypothetical protein
MLSSFPSLKLSQFISFRFSCSAIRLFLLFQSFSLHWGWRNHYGPVNWHFKSNSCGWILMKKNSIEVRTDIATVNIGLALILLIADLKLRICYSNWRKWREVNSSAKMGFCIISFFLQLFSKQSLIILLRSISPATEDSQLQCYSSPNWSWPTKDK